MSVATSPRLPGRMAAFANRGMFWLLVSVVSAAVFFRIGIRELLAAWQMPEYSHGPLIPVLSGLLFLRQLKEHPERPGPVADRGPGLAVMAAALLLGLGGNLLQIGDITAYAMILWVYAILLISFGWSTGRHFWPPVLHLVYMLPLPGALYYGVSTWLQGVSSELGVHLLRLLDVPVFLEGNIIDLGVYKLHVAEACSGLRYLFPILSFSYIFAVLYRGPTWHKAVLLLSAAPITVLMNSVRIAIAGWIVDTSGPEHVEGFSHFFEGWVIFIGCIALLFLLARLMLLLHPGRPGLADALDLDTSGLRAQAARIRHVQPSRQLIAAAGLTILLTAAWSAIPDRAEIVPQRDPFALFPVELGAWRAGPRRTLDAEVARTLAADDYHSVMLVAPDAAAPVDLFVSWYRTQEAGGVHSPEVCLPGGGWEIAALERRTAEGMGVPPFTYNRAIIQQGTERMLVFYWFEQQGQRTASGFTARMQLLRGKLTNGRDDSGLVRLITAIGAERGSIDAAQSRLEEAMREVLKPLPRFVPPA